jgi:xanthine dehydrogenase accessory factor
MPAAKRTNLKDGPLDLYRTLRDYLFKEEHAVLATVISRSGSGPREPGAGMLIPVDGEPVGTIGGGLLERKVLDLARAVMKENRSAIFSMDLTAPGGLTDDVMICGGRVEILMEHIDCADPLWLDLLDQMMEVEKGNRPCHFIRSLQMMESSFPSIREKPDEKGKNREIKRWAQTGLGLSLGDRFLSGSLDTAGWSSDLLPKHPQPPAAILIDRHPVRYFIQSITSGAEVVIVGAGHVGQALAGLCHFVGFKTVIIDDRPDYANPERFPAADDIRVQVSLENCFCDSAISENSYVVIVTRGHAFDRQVLMQALQTQAGYIGMIASKTKRDMIFKSLEEAGIVSEAIGRVHSPIGLPIGARTPEEIAVSIMAEMILVQSQKNKNIKPGPQAPMGTS